MSFDINTNIASLQAQQYLNVNTQFQSKTITRVTSGLRIVQSGDDAAGLAIANTYRNNETVLTQGIQNANSGLSQLQIIDGGMNNISQLLQRASTLATESATGTFTGDRGVLNSEFQSVLGEINRQSQAIGMNVGGTFAKNLSVFIGGGQGTTGAGVINNGSVSLNLTSATVDAKSLGLQGVQSIGAAGTDIGTGSSTTSVAKILANTNNQQAVAGYTNFVIQGPGFSGANGITVQVNLSGVTDANTLVTAVNAAITNAGNGTTQQATAFRNAGVTAAVNTDASGRQQLTFSSSGTALQVSAGDQMANALMGNFGAKAVMTGTDVTNSYTTTGSSDDYLALSFNGGPVMNFHIGTVAGITAGTVASDLNAISSFSANAVATADATTHKLSITSLNDNPNSTIAVSASTLATSLGLSGTATASATTGKSLAQSILVSAGGNTGNSTLVGTIVRFSGGGLASPVSITLGATATTYANAQADLLNQMNNNAALKAAGISATSATGSLTFTSNLGQAFSVSTSGDKFNEMGFGSYIQGANNSYDYTSITGANITTGATTDTLEISVAGGPAQQIQVTGFTADTAANLASLLNAKFAANTTLAAAGLVASGGGAQGPITITSSNGTYFRVAEGDNTAANQVLGFGPGTTTNTLTSSGNAGVQTSVATSTTNNFYFNSGGASSTKVFGFTAIANGQDNQTVSIAANDASGGAHSLAVVLSNNATSRSGESLDEAITAINTALQTSNDSTLQSIVAVKDNIVNTDGTISSQGVRFMSTLPTFTVNMSEDGTNGAVGIGVVPPNAPSGTATDQGRVQTAAQLAGGGTADISNQSTAQAAVTALGKAVTLLGSSQAVVGRGENQFTYAVNLAQSQLSNEQAAEASIRDADLASESANLTKAQILVQAGVAALAQANSAPQQVLTLLRG